MQNLTIQKLCEIFKERLHQKPPDPASYTVTNAKTQFVPLQVEAYFLALNRYVAEGSTVLDVGFGLGYGLTILAIKASQVSGVEVDARALVHTRSVIEGRNPRLVGLSLYNGYDLEFSDNSFDTVTCVDIIEHVTNYHRLVTEMLRVARKGVFLSTPNRRPEYTNKNGSPKNPYHLREWSYEEFDGIIRRYGKIDWNFLNGMWEGPFTISQELQPDTQALSPFIYKP